MQSVCFPFRTLQSSGIRMQRVRNNTASNTTQGMIQMARDPPLFNQDSKNDCCSSRGSVQGLLSGARSCDWWYCVEILKIFRREFGSLCRYKKGASWCPFNLLWSSEIQIGRTEGGRALAPWRALDRRGGLRPASVCAVLWRFSVVVALRRFLFAGKKVLQKLG